MHPVEKVSWKGTALRGVLLGLFLFPLAFPPFEWMVSRWTAPASCFAHGFLIPPISGYLFWRNRKALQKKSPSAWGLGVVIPALLLQAFGLLVQFHFLTAISLILVLMGLAFYFWGREGLRASFLPLVFLFFMVPLPLVIVADLTLRLKLVAIGGAVWLVRHLGVEVMVQGNALLLSKGTLFVGDACSGLRSLVALLAMGFLLSYLSSLRLFMKGILFLAAVPAALFSNMVRISFLSLLIHWRGKESAGGWVHDLTGLSVYLLALVLLIAMNRLLRGLPWGVR